MKLEIIEHKNDLFMLYYISIKSYNVVEYGYKVFVGIYLQITLQRFQSSLRKCDF